MSEEKILTEEWRILTFTRFDQILKKVSHNQNLPCVKDV